MNNGGQVLIRCLPFIVRKSMVMFWVVIWLICTGIALFGGEDWNDWTPGRKIAAFLALSPFIAAMLVAAFFWIFANSFK